MYYEINKRGGGILFVDGRIFKIDKRGLHIYREMRVHVF